MTIKIRANIWVLIFTRKVFTVKCQIEYFMTVSVLKLNQIFIIYVSCVTMLNFFYCFSFFILTFAVAI